MRYRNAATRAVRTFIQAATAALGVFYVAVASDGVVDFVEIRAKGEPLAYGVFLAVVSAAIAFGQNLTEDNTSLNIPK